MMKLMLNMTKVHKVVDHKVVNLDVFIYLTFRLCFPKVVCKGMDVRIIT